MTDPTLTEALATPCKRCGGMPNVMKAIFPTNTVHILYCERCNPSNSAEVTDADAARQWVEMNKEEWNEVR